MNLYIRKPKLNDYDQFKSLLFEYKKESEENVFLNGFIPLSFVVSEDFTAFLDYCEKLENGLVKDRVKATYFFSFRKSDNKLVGVINVRHVLNSNLRNFGGHIGYSIRASERNKGYAKQQLKLCLEFCKNELFLEKVLITANEKNLPSIKVILSFNPVEDQKYVNSETEEVFRRFWINLKN